MKTNPWGLLLWEGHEIPRASIFLWLSGQTRIFPANSFIPEAEARPEYLKELGEVRKRGKYWNTVRLSVIHLSEEDSTQPHVLPHAMSPEPISGFTYSSSLLNASHIK